MTVFACSSADASAPVLNGTTGSLLDVLDKLAVDGYGSHPGFGWSRQFTDTNKRVYKLPPGTSESVLLVNDDGTHDGGQAARVNGYRSASDVDTGVDPINSGATTYWTKSNIADATARGWRAFSDGESLLWLPRWSNSPSNPQAELLAFGDLVKAHDSPAGPISYFAGASGASQSFPGHLTPMIYPNPQHAECGVFPDADGSAVSRRPEHGMSPFSNSTYVFGETSFQDPMPNGLGTILQPYYVAAHAGGSTSNKWLAGMVPGLYMPWGRVTSVADGDIITGVPGFPGRDFMAVLIGYHTTHSTALVDITGPWR